MKENFFYLYTIKDNVAEEAGSLFEAVNDAVAQRQFKNLMKQPYTDPEDFQLLRVGSYNRSSLGINIYDDPMDITPKLEVTNG